MKSQDTQPKQAQIATVAAEFVCQSERVKKLEAELSEARRELLKVDNKLIDLCYSVDSFYLRVGDFVIHIDGEPEKGRLNCESLSLVTPIDFIEEPESNG